MDDPFILAGVLIGSAFAIALIVLINWLIGGWQKAKLNCWQHADRLLDEDLMGFEGQAGVSDAKGRAALVFEADNARLGAVMARGDVYILRVYKPGQALRYTLEGQALYLKTGDHTLPALQLDLSHQHDDELSGDALVEALSVFAGSEPSHRPRAEASGALNA